MEIGASQFKARCLELMDRVRASGEEILITKRGTVVAKLCPVSRAEGGSFGCMTEKGQIVGDVVDPVDQDWEAEAAVPGDE